jgi:hypothetical protein
MEPLLVSGFWEFGFGGPAKELVFTFLSRAPRIARERAPYRLSYPGSRRERASLPAKYRCLRITTGANGTTVHSAGIKGHCKPAGPVDGNETTLPA